MKKSLRIDCLSVALIFSTLLGAGCGREKVGVKGIVTLDDVPLTIDFNPADGQGGNMGAAIKDGKFELIGELSVLPGKKTAHPGHASHRQKDRRVSQRSAREIRGGQLFLCWPSPVTPVRS